MGLINFIKNLGGRNKERKEEFRELYDRFLMEKKLEEIQKSSNQRELERFLKEEREEQIKETLDFYRKKRQNEINFGANPLNVKNITNHTDWEVMKEKNMFKGNKNLFSNQDNIIKDNPNLLKNNRKLCGI